MVPFLCTEELARVSGSVVKKKAEKIWLAMAWPLHEEVKKVKVGKSKREARRLGTEKGWSGSVCQLLDITLPFLGFKKLARETLRVIGGQSCKTR